MVRWIILDKALVLLSLFIPMKSHLSLSFDKIPGSCVPVGTLGLRSKVARDAPAREASR